MIAAFIFVGGATSDLALELYSTPLGTPSIIESVAVDANLISAASRLAICQLTTPRTLTANTAYAIGVKQTTANALTVNQYDVNTATHFRPNSYNENIYAATSTAAATFAAINSGKRRYAVFARICKLDDGAGVMVQSDTFVFANKFGITTF